MKYLQSRSDVLTLEKLSESTNRLYLRVSAKKDEHTSQFSDMFFEHACFLIAPTRFEEKHEIWTLGSSNRENISLVYEKLKKNHPVSISYLKEDSFNVLLTQKQQEILNYAKHFGYYEWPRQNSITNICSMINIPKTVFLSHLRKAEKKIMSQFLQDS